MNSANNQHHCYYMHIALKMAQRALGNTAPNPAVGCIIVKNKQIISYGWTQQGGRPHAEIHAINQIKEKEKLKQSTMYVTLEPCSHFGKTPPCIQQIIQNKINHVVIATQDPNPQVSGNGIKKLKEANIQVTTSIMQKEAIQMNKGFFTLIKKKRPYIAIKCAVTIDGNISSTSGDSKWISNANSRIYSQMLRYHYDAIMIGSNTAIKDDPSLTCRITKECNFSPLRILIDSNLKTLNYNLKIIKDKHKTIVFNTLQNYHNYQNNVELIKITATTSDSTNLIPITKIINKLAEMGITRLLVEGGSKIITSLLLANLVDKLYIFRAPKISGRNEYPLVGNININNAEEMQHMILQDVKRINDNILEIYKNQNTE